MPRGYFKNQKGISKKVARGGGSADCRGGFGRIGNTKPKGPLQAATNGAGGTRDGRRAGGKRDGRRAGGKRDGRSAEHHKPIKMRVDPEDVDTAVHDAVWVHAEEETAVLNVAPQQENEGVVGECIICCEIRPLVRLLNNCRHPSACFRCLRIMYVLHAQQDVSKYPLKCFHPVCGLPVRETQLQAHGLARTDKEMTRHHRMTVLSRVYRQPNKVAVHCPKCDHPASVTGWFKLFFCLACQWHSVNGIDALTTRALEALTTDDKGANDGFARCPKCQMVISKGDGCRHMVCYCGENFFWPE